MNLNKIQIIGRLTRDPELRTTPGGTNVCQFSVATSHNYKNPQTNQMVEHTTFHNVVAFGKRAETIKQYFTKGQEIYVEGRQEHRTYDKQDGSKGYASEIILENFSFGAKPKGTGVQGSADQSWEPTDMPPEAGGEDINVEDIPF